MDLTITDYAFTVSRVDGGRKERICAQQKFLMLKKGDKLVLEGPVDKEFRVLDVVEGEKITLEINVRHDKMDIHINKVEYYRPLSFGGGHYYTFELV